MSFLFPRLVRLSRPQGNAALGAQGYSGLSQATEQLVYSAAKAHIQPERQGAKPLPGLPADAEGQPVWRIVVKLPKGLIRQRDVLTDDLGLRYQVIYAAWNPLSTSVLAVQLNVVGVKAVVTGGIETISVPVDSLTDPWGPLPWAWTPINLTNAAFDQQFDPWAVTFDTLDTPINRINLNVELLA